MSSFVLAPYRQLFGVLVYGEVGGSLLARYGNPLPVGSEVAVSAARPSSRL